MALTALVVVATTAVVKKTVDELFTLAKDLPIAAWRASRTDVKDSGVAKALVGITKVKTLWSFEKETSLYDFYYPSNVEISEGVVKAIESSKGFGTLQNFVIQGTAGQGKSIFLRYLCGQELRPITSSGRIPIFVELRRIKEGLNLNKLILETLQKLKLPSTEEAWQVYGKSGKFVLMLDGFDEILPALADRTVGEIEHEADLYSETLQIFVTSRPDGDIQKSSKFRVCKLAGLKPSDHGAFLKRICTDRTQAENLAVAIGKSSTDVQQLLTTPLMMTLLVILYKSQQTIPDTVPKFYEELFDVLFYRHDHSKPGFRRQRFTHLDDSALKRLFSAFCFYVRLKGLGVLTNKQLEECCEQAQQACSVTVDALKFKNELIKTVCLLQEDGFEISFIHKSVAQYYAASFIAKSSEGFIDQFYKLASEAEGWALELRFLCELDSYRYMKKYELPLLRKLEERLGIDDPSEKKEHQWNSINEYFSPKVHFITSANDILSNGKVIVPKHHITGWYPLSESRGDVVIKELLGAWMMPVYSKLRFNSKYIDLIFNLPEQQRNDIPVKNFSALFLSDAEEVARSVIHVLSARRQKALSVIKTEEEKTAMLTAFVRSGNTATGG